MLTELGVANGAIVTLEALHCRKHFEVAAKANVALIVQVKASVALIVQVKDNQRSLRQPIQEISATTAPLNSVHSRDKRRNCDESRTVTVFDPDDKLADTDWLPYVAAIIHVERDVFTRQRWHRAAPPCAPP